jgi:alkylation response protein AidB-like acyl-CoA dehydrogenase
MTDPGRDRWVSPGVRQSMSVAALRSSVQSQGAQPAAVLARLRAILPEIQARAPGLDAAGAFPTEDIARLKEIGAIEAFGGERASPLELMEALRLVGRANLSLGRIFEGHVNGARLVAWYGDAVQQDGVEEMLRAGRVFGVWNTEPAPVTIEADERGRPVLRGGKSFATGAGFIDFAIVTATFEGGGRRMVIVTGNTAARTDPASWRVRGMKSTVSGTYDLTGLPAGPEVRLGKPGDYEREPRFSAGAWRFTAVQLGGVERVIGLLREHLAETPGKNDPIHRARFGEALAAARSAYLWVREAALRAESPLAGAAEIAFVLMTRGVVERAGLQAMEAAARTVGTRAFFDDHPIDQACRDLALYLRQPAPDQALDRAAAAFIEQDCWRDDPLW